VILVCPDHPVYISQNKCRQTDKESFSSVSDGSGCKWYHKWKLLVLLGQLNKAVNKMASKDYKLELAATRTTQGVSINFPIRLLGTRFEAIALVIRVPRIHF
jgi:hypothetical protein